MFTDPKKKIFDDKKRNLPINKLTPIKAPLTLSPEFNAAIQEMERSKGHYFITGKAGTGKSTLLSIYRKTTRKKTAVLAPTGIAALNVRGQTIHSFFGFPPKMLEPNELTRRRNWRMYANVETIIIDEISMVRADMMDNIDLFLRNNRGINKPFGGVQMIFYGDLFQLPPIIASPEERLILTQEYESPYFFSSRVVKDEIEVHTIELTHVYRQDNRGFVNLLDRVRKRDIDYDDIDELNNRHDPDIDDAITDFYITLTSTNATVNALNSKKLSAIDQPEITYTASVKGTFNPRRYPAESLLKLKVGAQVMFVKNDPDKRFVNGTIGKIVTLSEQEIKVLIIKKNEEEQIIDVQPLEWEIIKYRFDPTESKLKSDIIGVYKQYPLRLAWAITIHKSQGQTFEKVIIDLGRGAFEYGQTYVALSRCTTLEGIILKKKLTPNDIKVDERITEFYQSIA